MKRHIPLVLAGVLSIVLTVSFSDVSAFKDDAPATQMLPLLKKADPLQESDISRFTNAITQIKDFYVQPVGDKKLLEDAIRGMLNGLDPHSEYLDEDAYKTLLMTTTGAFGG